MLRRKPTLIELKMADLVEYDTVKKQRENKNKAAKADVTCTPEVLSVKTRTEMIHARIGYDPKPLLPQVSSLPH